MKSIFKHLLIFFLVSTFHSYSQTNKIIDSLVKELDRSKKNDIAKAQILDQLSYNYSKVDADKGISFANQLYKLSKEINHKKGIAAAYLDLGLNYSAKNNHDKTLHFYNQAINAYQELGDSNGEAAVLSNLSLMYLNQSDYTNSLDYGFKAVTIYESINKFNSCAIVLENLGTIYMEQKNFEKAMEYYTKSYNYYKKENNSEGMARSIGNQGIIYSENGDYANALKCHLAAYNFNKKIGAKSSMQINLANIGIFYEKEKKYNTALRYHLEALKISQEIKDRKSIAINYGNAGGIYLLLAKAEHDKLKKINNLTQSIEHLKEAIQLCNAIGFRGPLIEFNEKLSEAYSLIGDDKAALQAFKNGITARDSLNAADLKTKFATIELNRELLLKEKEITLTNQQIKIKELESRNKKIEHTLLVIGIFILFAVVILLVMRFRNKTKKHKSVLKEIAWQQCHEVRAPLARILGLINVIEEGDINSYEFKEHVLHLKSSAIELDDVIRKIVSHTKS